VKPVSALLATGAALTAAALVVPAAEAQTRPSLRSQLNKARTELARANAQLKATRKELARARVQIRTLRSQVSQLQTDLDASQAQAAALQAQLDGIATPLAFAEEQVRREVFYEEHQALPYSHGRLVAQAAMDYVVGHVSASAYGYLEVTGGALPLPTPDSTLGTQAGICGFAALTFAAIVKHFGYQVRSVQFYYTEPPPYSTAASHVAVEVYYDGGWHFFDPTFGVLWVDQTTGNVQSITEARAGLGTKSKDEATFTNLAEDFFFGDGTAFETDPATTVVLDGQPM
jgi:hypothetical protein